MSSQHAYIPLFDEPRPCDFVCHRVIWCLIRVCVVCVFPQTHLTARRAELQQSWQCMTKCPPWTCLNGTDCSNEAGPTRQSTCGWGTGERWKRLGCMSIFLTMGQGDFVLGLKNGNIGIDRTTWGHWKTRIIVPPFGFQGAFFLWRDGKLHWQWGWWMPAPLPSNIGGSLLCVAS